MRILEKRGTDGVRELAMGVLGRARTQLSRSGDRAGAGTLRVFAATIFLSAFLLFSVQPMFAKMVTPKLGGTPAVWSVAMVFFQAMLLAGYGYAHLLVRRFDVPKAAMVHLGLSLVVIILALPITLFAGLGEPPEQGQAFWLIALFALSVGLPFFAVSANGPLLQAWFARSGHPHAGDPYFLYGASNIGSFLALLAYPFIIEPMLPLAVQSKAWSGGFMLLAAGIAVCGLAVLRAGATERAAEVSPSVGAIAERPAEATGLGAQRLAWIGLSLIPSAHLIAVTAHVSTDIAAVPLLWVVPLALYLATFVLAFRSGGERMHGVAVQIQPVLLAGLLLAMVFAPVVPLAVQILAHVGYFLVATLVCHGELYRRRPSAARLTEFYFFLSLGGVVGGVLASLLAPAVLNSLLEYPLLIAATVLCRPGVLSELARLDGRWRAAAGTIAAIVIACWLAPPTWLPGAVVFPAIIALICAIVIGRERPVALALATPAALAVVVTLGVGNGLVERTRSFFGVHSVYELAEGRARFLGHGNTVHGAEWYRDAEGRVSTARPEPASYFHRGGVYAQAIDAARAAQGGLFDRVAVIGLGMGSLACHALPGERWRFYEIDPVVVRIARDTSLFRSFTVCTPDAEVVVGDGRLTLAKSAEVYDLIILDAFSSDAVPVHLLTAEALALYASKLAEKGMIIFNVNNRHMELAPIVAASAAKHGLKTWFRPDARSTDFARTLTAHANIAVVARSADAIAGLAADPSWKVTAPDAKLGMWTDDYSNVLASILRKKGW